MAYTEIGIDTSHWNPYLDTAKLKGLDFIIGRMGTQLNNVQPAGWLDSTFTNHCQVAADLDVPYGAYWYDDYTWFLDNGWTWGAISDLSAANDPRIVTIKKALFAGTAMRRVHFLVIDVEQETRGGKELIEPNWCSKSAQTLFENLLWMMNHGELPVMPILIYSRKSFVDKFIANGALEVWMQNQLKSIGPERMGCWVADWRYNRSNNGVYSMATLPGTLPLETSKPALFSDVPTWMWQYGADKGRIAYLDGVFDDRKIPLAADINTLMLPLEKFYQRVGFQAVGEPSDPGDPSTPPPMDGDVKASLARIEANQAAMATVMLDVQRKITHVDGVFK